MNGLRNLAELAADDAQAEREIEQLNGEELLALAAYAAERDERCDAYSTDQREEQVNLRALAYCLPIALASLVLIALVWL